VVTPRVRPGESGKIKLGCLFTLAIMAAIVYFGFDFAQVQMRFYRIQDEVKTRATFAPVFDDATIRRGLVAKSDSLGLPLGPRDWTVKRTYEPREITISATYTDSVVIELPGVFKVFYFTFNPHTTSFY
jgi:hypothetical protein